MATKKQCDRCEVLATEGRDTANWRRVRVGMASSNHYTEREVCKPCAAAVEHALEPIPKKSSSLVDLDDPRLEEFMRASGDSAIELLRFLRSLR